MMIRGKKSRRFHAATAIAFLAGAALAIACAVAGCSTTPGSVEKTAANGQAVTSSNGFSQNGLTTNGLLSNGAWFNGAWFNGAWFNGAWFNGAWFNGAWFNGAWFNGAWFNGAWFNGAWFNGLFSNALWANGVNPDGGAPAAGSPAAALQSSPYLRQLLPYIYGCAMPGALDPITNTPIDPTTYDTALDPNNGTLKCAPPGLGGEEAGADGGPACDVGYTCSAKGTCVIALHGAVGLAINANGSAWWGETADGGVGDPGVGDGGVGNGGVGGAPGTCDETCQRWVSACVLARTNAYGAHVEISMRAPANAPQAIKNALATSPPEVASFGLREGAYYGNIFESAPTPLVCSGPSNSCAAAGPPSATCYTQCVSASPPLTPDGGPYSGPATGPVAETPTFYACAGPGSNIPGLTKRFCSSQGDQVVINVPGVCLTTPTEQGTCAAEDTDGGSSTFGAIQHCYTSPAARSANPCVGPDDPACYDQVITVYLKDPIAVCGNGVCESNTEPDGGAGGENSTNCPSDCPPGAWAKDFDPSFESIQDQIPPFGNASSPEFGNYGMAAVAPDDTIVVVGDTQSNVNLGDVTLPASGGAGVLVKYNPDGSYAWPARGVRFGNTISSSTILGATGITVAASGTSKGNIAVVGVNDLTLWVSTFTAAGTPSGMWSWTLGSSSSLQVLAPGRALAVDSKGNVLVAGDYRGTATFPTVPPTSLTSTSTAGSDVFLTEISPQGSIVWAQNLDVDQYPQSLVVDSHDNIVLAAQQCTSTSCAALVKLCAGGTCGQCANGSAATQCVSSAGHCADGSTPHCADGSTAWTKNFGGVGYYTAATADTMGNVYATGSFATNIDFGGGSRAVTGDPPFIVKYDPNGNWKWDNHGVVLCPPSPLGCGYGQVWGTNLGFDKAQNVVLASSGDPSLGGGIDFGVGTFPTYHSTNIFLAAYEPNAGSPQWAKQIPAILGVDVRGIALDSQGRVVVSGIYGGSIQIDDSLLVTAVPEDPNTVDPFVASFGGPSPLDTTPPTIGAGVDQTGASINTVPNTIVAQATSQCGAVVFFMPPTAIDNGDPDAGAPPPGTSVACSPPPNTTFPIGSKPVECTASDPFGHAQSATFTVTVADTLAPAFLPFADIQVQAPNGASSVPVSYAPRATDQVDCSTPASVDAGTACTPTLNPCTPVSCTPPSGSTFAVGSTTPVKCTATDKAKNTSQMTFSVNVTAPMGIGGTCSSTGQCASGTCVDGVCCNTTATSCGQCQACNVPGSAGTCAPTSGGSCDDGNACTQNDTCQGGVCTGSNLVTCGASDQCHGAGTCNPSTGACSNPAAPNGTACNDGNACTQNDTCQGGVCTGSNLVTCGASDQCHGAGTCNPSTGACSNPAAPNGTACTDGNACTQNDTCQAGTCVGANPVACAATDQCHVGGTCNPSTGACSNPAAPNGTACNDGNACTLTDTCQAGTCVGSNPTTCGAIDQCHVAGTCNPTTGACTTPAATDGTACDDGNACTRSDTCQAGTCTGANPVACPASDACHLPGTCDPSTGQCSNPAAPSGTAGCGGTPAIGSFAVYATEAIELSSGASISGCNVGVEGSGGPFLAGGAAAYLSSGAKIQSSQTLYASSVYLSSGASVGPVDTNHVMKSSGATYGKVSTFPAMPAPPAPPGATAGTTAVTVGSGSSKTLASGAYGNVTVSSGSTLKLTGGNYAFSSLTLSSGATLSVTASTVLSVTGAATISSGSSMGPSSASGLTAKGLAVYFASSKITISSGAKVRALLVAPNALVTVSTSSFSGAIAASQVLLSSGATVACEDGLGSLNQSNTITVTLGPALGCGGTPEGDVEVDISDSNDDVGGSTPSASGASTSLTLPTPVATGSAYQVTVSPGSDVYTCTFDSSGQSTATGVVAGPVNLSVTCIRNNC